MIKTPVLLIAFNRPDTTLKVLEGVRLAKPSRLYVAVDGPRAGVPGEAALCEKVRSIVKDIDWECECFYRFSNENRGPEVTVSTAITWALDKEESVIVLEDDVVAPLSFFQFMEEMLTKYSQSTQIAMVSGCNPSPGWETHDDYLFGVYGHTFGWGTWKRAWDQFNLNVNNFASYNNTGFLKTVANSRIELSYLQKMLKTMESNEPGTNTWDYCWFYLRVINKWLTIIPRANLVSNIGVYGFHSSGETEFHFMKVDENFKITNHPRSVQRDDGYDSYHFRNHIYETRPFHQRVIRKLRRMVKSVLAK